MGFGFFCFHALGDTKQKKPTPLDRGPPLHVNRVLTLASFFHGSSNQALWNIHTAVSPSGIDTEWEASQEFLPPLTQLITKCKRRTKITRKIKRSKQSHCYYPLAYHLICCVNFRTETNYSSATSEILHLLLGMITSDNATRLRHYSATL